jgi:hypothetical protein
VRHDAAENVMHKASGTFDHLEYIKVVNMPSTSSCYLGLVPSYWLQHHEGLASHMSRCTASLPAAGYSLGGRQSETLTVGCRGSLSQSWSPNLRGWTERT